MSRTEKFIQDNTRNCSNVVPYSGMREGSELRYHGWLTPDQARKAVEIAREEIYDWLRQVSLDDYKIADEESYRMGCPYDYIDVHGLIDSLKQAMKDE